MARKEQSEYGSPEMSVPSASPGQLYREISITREKFSAAETKLLLKPVHPFVKFCKRVHKAFPSLGKGEKLNADNKAAVEFLGWDLTGEEFGAAYKFSMFAAFIISVIIGVAIYLSPVAEVVELFVGNAGFLVPVYIFLPMLGVAAYATFYVQNYPIKKAREEQLRALTYVPEILGYMVMSMKLVPNLEKSIEFAAEHGRGKIAEDFKKLLWDVQLGVYNSLSEGLDALAYRWGSFSDEFKKALMRIRASVIESTEAKRHILLDSTMDEILESVKAKMEQYARDLSQPSVMLFYIGVLLPLILIIILPVGSSFTGAPLANPIVLTIIYNLLIPGVTFLFALSVISKKPPTYDPPVINDNYPGLPPKGKMRLGNGLLDIRLAVIGLLLLGVGGSILLSQEGIPPKSLYELMGIEDGTPQLLPADKSAVDVLGGEGLDETYYDIPEGQLYGEYLRNGLSEKDAGLRVIAQRNSFYAKSDNDITPYNLVFGLLITLAMCVFVYMYYNNIYKRNAQLEVMGMEAEFRDSLYILASRMGENKPVEQAIKDTKDFLPQYKISQRIFAKILDNIALLAMPLEQAVFDKNYGALKNIPSSTINVSMKLLVDSVQLGVNVAARTMIALSIQLGNAEKVEKNLKVLISDITGMMKTMSLFVAPVVLGITTSLQKIVIITLSSIAVSNITQSATTGGNLSTLADADVLGGVDLESFTSLASGNFINPDAISQIASPAQFIIIVAIYVIELSIIMTFFTTKIEEDNNLLLKLNIAKYFPISIIVFVIAVIASNLLIGSFLG